MKTCLFASFAALAVMLLCSPALAEDYGQLNWDNSTKHLVVEKAPSEWAAKGVKPGDRIVKVDGVKLVNLSQASARLRSPGTVKLSLLRDGWENELVVPTVSLERLGLAKRAPVPMPKPEPKPQVKPQDPTKSAPDAELVQRAIARLKAAGFSAEQIKMLMDIFELEPRDVMLGLNNHSKLLKSGFSSPQAKALLRTFKIQGEAAPSVPKTTPTPEKPQPPKTPKETPGVPGEIKTIAAAKAYALSKSVPVAAIDKLIELGKRLGWEDKKIIDNILNLAKMKTGAATPNPVPGNPNRQQGMPKMQKAPDLSEFSPALQAAIKRCAERTNMPMGFILGLTKQMMKANRSEKDVIKLLDSMKMSAPKDKNNGGGSPFGK